MKAVNLLPPDLRSTRSLASVKATTPGAAASGSGAFVVLGALALSVLALAGAVLADNDVKEGKAELAGVTARHAAATQRAAALKPYEEFQMLAAARVQTVKQLADSRFDWEQALRDLARAVPADVTLASLNGTTTNGTQGGGNQLRGALAVPAIELTGCARSQRNVARLMARLRNVQGVTRVSLSKSDKEGSTGAVAGVAGARPSGPCGVGNPPTFEVVAFFEGDAELSVAPGQPAAAPGGATPQPTATPAAGQPASTGGSSGSSSTGGAAAPSTPASNAGAGTP